MLLAAQYYRPPFPDKKHWLDDLSRMRDSGLNALQLWAVWGWIEPEPGVFHFDDYDTLVKEAEKRGLGVIISCIAEIHPFWIHRVVPDSHLVDHLGRIVHSVGRVEVNPGLTPGGCFDNPKVRERMAKYIERLAAQYANAPNLKGWDAWNETRWMVHAQGHACYCEHTVAAFRDWLKSKYGDLDGLNEAWKRRYAAWEDVEPGRMTGLLPTEMVEFCDFLAWRAAMHMRFRYKILKAANPKVLVSAHNAQPCISDRAGGSEHVMCRGNDFDHAAELDGFGCSHFPFWGTGFDPANFGVRMEFIRSACRGKVAWVSELQGGAANSPALNHSRSVSAGPQQRWVWSGYGRGAKAVIFWCWRDEVFGQESSGFGIAGRDGLAEERLAALKRTGSTLEKYSRLLDAYRPDPAEVGVYFDRANHFLDYVSYGRAERSSGGQMGYALAFERLNVPYRFIESKRLDDIDGLKLLVMPFSICVSEEAAGRIAGFVKNGGTLLVEAETGAFSPLGFYNADPAERPLARELGIRDLGRRELTLDKLSFSTGAKLILKPSTLYTPLVVGKGDKVLCKQGADTLALLRKVGKGQVVAVGTFLGDKYCAGGYADFEEFVGWLVGQAGITTPVTVSSNLKHGELAWRSGVSGTSRLVFVSAGPKTVATVRGPNSVFGKAEAALELLSGKTLKLSKTAGGCAVKVPLAENSVAVVKWDAE
jgi:beta-galactosidase